MRSIRCQLLSGLTGLLACSLAVAPAAAAYPETTIKIIVPFPPGGSSDLTARLLANHLSERFKRTVIIENRPGGDGMLAPTLVARAKPDGYTLLLGAPTLATARATMKSLPIQPTVDLEGVSLLVESPYVVAINASLPATDLQSFIAYTKANPGKLFYGSWSTSGQLIYGLLKLRSGADLTHVAFKGEAVTVAALAGNEVQAVFATAVNVIPRQKDGVVRVLAVTADLRLSTLPEVPTAAEAGVKGFTPSVWFGILAPKGTQMDIKTKLSEEIAVFVKRPDTIERLRVVGFEPKASMPDEFTKFLESSEKQWLDVAAALGITPQ